MHQEALLTTCLDPKGTSSLIGGQLPSDVLSKNHYISVLAAEAETHKPEDAPALDDIITTALSKEDSRRKLFILVGPAGSGKTTALEKLKVDWARGERLQNFSCVFHFQFSVINAVDGMVSLETLLLQHYEHFTTESLSIILKKSKTCLFIFDGLDRYIHTLDPTSHALCSDPSQPVSAACLVASLFHGALMKGAAFLLATRHTESLTSLDGQEVELLGFLKTQRKAYFNQFFPDPAVADVALLNMERTLRMYEFCAMPRFCWTVCSLYKSLLETGNALPQTLTQLLVSVTVCVIRELSLEEFQSKELVSALGRMASNSCLDQHSYYTKKELASFGLQQFLTSQTKLGAFLEVDGDLESDGCVFSFHTQLIQEFVLAVSIYLNTSTSESVKDMLTKHKGHVEFLDTYLAGLSEPTQRKPLEALLGAFNLDQVADFRGSFRSDSKEALQTYDEEKHLRCFRLLHQCQNEHLVKEIIDTSARIGLGYGGLRPQDCMALSYVVTCLGDMKRLNLYYIRLLTEDEAEMLIPAMRLSEQIILSQSFLGPGSISHLAAAVGHGRTKELDLSQTNLDDEGMKTLCAAVKDSKLHTLKIINCKLTAAGCGDLLSALTSGTCELVVLELMHNKIQDQGLVQLCQALRSPHCKLEEILLGGCELTGGSMEALSSALCSGQSELRRLNLRMNDIGDVGMDQLSKALQHPCCKLQSLILYGCDLTAACCESLAAALRSENWCLRALDLSANELNEEGALKLCKALRNPGCQLEELSLELCELTPLVFQELGSALSCGTSRLKSLSVGCNRVKDQGVKHLWDAVANPGCPLEFLDVEMTGLTDACLVDLCAAVRASGSLRSLGLKNNGLTDESVPALVQVMKDSHSMQEMNLQYNDFSEDVLDILDECGKIKY